MKAKLSEVKLLLAFVLIVAAFAILSTVKFFNSPVQVSEIAFLFSAFAIGLMFFAVKLFRSGIKKA